MRPSARAVLALKEELPRQALQGMLRDFGFHGVKLCYTCDDVVSVMGGASRRWGVLILDHSLPESTDTVRLLRNRLGPHLKIVMVIPSPRKSDILDATDAGADDVITFPVSPATFEKKLHRLTGVPAAPPRPQYSANGHP